MRLRNSSIQSIAIISTMFILMSIWMSSNLILGAGDQATLHIGYGYVVFGLLNIIICIIAFRKSTWTKNHASCDRL